MGLEIHWDFAFKGTWQEAKATLERIRFQAKNLPLAELGEVRPIPHDYNNCAEIDRWAAIHYQERRSLSGKCPNHPAEDGRKAKCYCSIHVNPVEGYYFSAWPGEGCESMEIGLARYRRGRVWKGSAFCKTQYSEDFFQAHQLVIALLDICKAEGILKSVDDDGDYWQTRDLGKLAVAIGEYTALVSGISRQLQTIFGAENVGGAAIEELQKLQLT